MTTVIREYAATTPVVKQPPIFAVLSCFVCIVYLFIYLRFCLSVYFRSVSLNGLYI